MKGFFEAMAPLAHPPLTVAHRFVESEAGLAYYAKRPDGLMWRSKELFDTPVYYLAFHGRPGAVRSLLERIEADKLCEAFAGYGGYRNLVYFACCNVLRGEKGRSFARAFLKVSGVKAVIGYTTTRGLDGEPGLRHAVPAPLLQRSLAVAQSAAHIQSVQRDYPAARRLGYTLVTQ